MTNISTLWNGMDARGRLIALLAALATAAAVFGLARMASSPPMALLYAGLDPAAAGGVVSALEARQTPYEVRGDSIFVPQGERDALRLSLAAEGRPESGAAGYELLDGLSGFGTTRQMFDAAYWRAKEGELARTILALPQVRAARVHVANPVRGPFEREVAPSASVALRTAGGALSPAQAEAVRFLVASAVAGLSADRVAVIDAETGLTLAGPGPEAGAAGGDRAETLKTNVERLLAARVGADSVIVEVTVDADMNSETVRERVLDPDGRVAVHSDVEETTESSQGGAGGGVTVASNLPDGDANGGGGGASSSSSETRERTNWEVSEVLRERVRRPGEVRRITVAVLVDGVREAGPDGTPRWAPRPEEEIEALRELVESAVGFDAARGDEVTIRSLEFAPRPELGTSAEAADGGWIAANAMRLVQLGVLAGTALLLGLFVLRPLLAPPPPPPAVPVLAGAPGALGLEGPSAGPAGLPDAAAAAVGATLAAKVGAGGVDAEGVSSDRLAALRSAADERQDDVTALLARWLDDPEEEKAKA